MIEEKPLIPEKLGRHILYSIICDVNAEPLVKGLTSDVFKLETQQELFKLLKTMDSIGPIDHGLMWESAEGLSREELTEIITGELVMTLSKGAVKKAVEKYGTNPFPDPLKLSEIAEKRKIEKKLEENAPSTGWNDLDDLMTGFVPTYVYLLSADTGVGKTTICANFACSILEQKKRVLYFSLEPRYKILDYVASIKHRKRFDQLTEKDLEFDEPNFEVYTDEIDTPEKLLDAIDRQPRYDVIFIDHIGYFVKGTADSTTQEQANLMKQIVKLAYAKQSAVVFVAHQNKSKLEWYDPNAISGSASFKQDATNVLMMMREKEEDGITYTNRGKLAVVKSKTGKLGSFDLYFTDMESTIRPQSQIDQTHENPSDRLTLMGFPDKGGDEK